MKLLTDKAKAESVVLRESDFPSAWTGTPHKKDPSEAKSTKQLAQCIGAADLGTHDTVNVDGPDVDNGSAQVSSSANFVRTLGEASKDLAAITSPKFATCFRQLATPEFRRTLSQEIPGATLAGLTFLREPTGAYGGATVAYRLVATAKVGSQRISVYQDFVAILKGRCEISVIFQDIGHVFDTALEQRLLQTLDTRIERI